MNAKRLLSSLLAALMVFSMLPFVVSASEIVYDDSGEDEFYKVVSNKTWELAPGVVEAEIVLNNSAGDRRQVMHVVEVDINNPYTKVIPSSKGMIPTPGKYGVQTMDLQTAYAEANGYGNVVAAMNISLSWYDNAYYEQHPELVGEPLGYLILNGVQYTNSQGKTAGAKTCLVINFDEKDGVARPADMPKTQIRSTADPITGWEEQVIPANFGFVVKDGKRVTATENHTSEGASRSMLGIKADGTIVMVMNDGRQAPYSTGFNDYEMSDAMLKLGCVYAINGDGGGSSQFLSQRPGEEMELHCSPSDGAPRATTHGVLVITTAPSDGTFVRAHVEAENEYYTPNSSVQFTATGADLAGGAAEIPEDAYWALSDDTMGTIDENGLFVSTGKVGEVAAQLIYEDEVKGSATINVVVPQTIAFGAAAAYTVPFEDSIDLNITAKYDVFDVVLKPSDYTVSIKNSALGTLDGLKYTAGNTAGTTDLTVTLTLNTAVSKTIPLTVGKGSQIIFDFEEGTPGANLNNWVIKDHEGKYPPYADLSIVTSENGMVHDGNTALAVHMPTHTHIDGSEGYNANSITWVGDRILLENATAIGMWVYIPEEATQTEIALNYIWYNASGVQQRTTPDLCLNDTFNGNEYSGWHYRSVPIAKNLAYIEDGKDVEVSQGYKRNFFLKFYVTNSGNAGDESSYMGDITYYIDSVTVDYSSAVSDRISPEFIGTYVKNINNDSDIALTFSKNVAIGAGSINFFATVSDNIAIDAASATVYVDGVKISATYRNGRISSEDVDLLPGTHRVVFEIADAAGNIQKAVRYITIAGEGAAAQVVPHNPEKTIAYTGSVYWLDVVVANAEKVSSITMKLDLDTMNVWELANAVVAYGYDMEYSYASIADKKDNLITVVLTNNGSTLSGTAVVAQLPIRVWSYCGNDASSDITPAEAWAKGFITAVSVNVEVEKGEVIYKDNSFDIFSAEKIHIDTEAYIHQYKMDKTYFANNTYHVHTPVALKDRDANCTEKGYIGRTFCEVCDSVVEWGTVIPATGHSYTVVDGVLACSCGDTYKGNGIVTVGGKTYYMMGDKLNNGWWMIDEEWYYFDTTTYAAVESYNNGHVTFKFEENGKLIAGEWDGLRYYYGPDYYAGNNYGDKRVTIDGKDYVFTKQGYARTGYDFERVAYGNESVWYDFGTDGAIVGRFLHNGLYVGQNGYTYVLKDGITVYGMSYIDGAYYYSASANYKAVITNTERQCPVTNGLLPVAIYRFGADGKMIDKNVFNLNGTLYYYEMGKISKGNGIFTVNGSDFVIEADGKVLYTGMLTDASGRNLYYVNGVESKQVKNGLIKDADGEIRYYVDDVAVYAGLVQDADGNYYYINSSKKAIKNTSYTIGSNKTNGLLDAGRYTFGADGKMINPPVAPEEPKPEEPTVKNGVIVDEDGEVRYYVNGVATYAGLVQDAEGNYYYINSSKKAIKNTSYTIGSNKTNGLLDAGRYTFGADGKMINPPVAPEEPKPEEPTVKNGIIVDEDGEVRYYVNGVATYAGLVQDAEGNYYYINSSKKAVKNTSYTIGTAKTNGLLEAGRYTFGADGKMIIG